MAHSSASIFPINSRRYRHINGIVFPSSKRRTIFALVWRFNDLSSLKSSSSVQVFAKTDDFFVGLQNVSFSSDFCGIWCASFSLVLGLGDFFESPPLATTFRTFLQTKNETNLYYTNVKFLKTTCYFCFFGGTTLSTSLSLSDE